MHLVAARRAVNILPGLEVRRKPVLNFLDCILEGTVYFLFFLGIVHSEVILYGYIPRSLHRPIADFLQNFSCSAVFETKGSKRIRADPSIRLLDSIYLVV
jgi:hypothetical protein